MMTELPDLDTLLKDTAMLMQQVQELTERLAETQHMVIRTVKESSDDRVE